MKKKGLEAVKKALEIRFHKPEVRTHYHTKKRH